MECFEGKQVTAEIGFSLNEINFSQFDKNFSLKNTYDAVEWSVPFQVKARSFGVFSGSAPHGLVQTESDLLNELHIWWRSSV